MNTTTAASNSRTATARHLFTTKELVLGGMFAAVMAVFSQISLPMPTGVPITIQVFAVALIGVVLGWKLGLLSMVTYILIGAIGLPVFANFHGGLGSLVGLTGGYIWAWPFMVALCGIRPNTDSPRLNLLLTVLLSLAGLALVEIIGGLQWAALAGNMSVSAVFAYSMVAFVPKDIIITILGVILGIPMRRAIGRVTEA